ncbi:hypothetical protein LV779_01220 [Streptomyces thinghirensis]|nr:hypothetical protein [Streptomyces thinghirensis]
MARAPTLTSPEPVGSPVQRPRRPPAPCRPEHGPRARRPRHAGLVRAAVRHPGSRHRLGAGRRLPPGPRADRARGCAVVLAR